jgi:hypothetical protein
MARRKDAFLVNLWFERNGPGEPRAADWRGSVEHLTTRRRLYFTDIVELVTFLAGYTAPPHAEDGGAGADV